MSDLSAGLFRRHYSRLATGAMMAATLAGLCLGAAGCAAATPASSAPLSPGPSPASYAGAPLTLNNAPGLSSAFGSTTAPRSTAAPRDTVAAGPPSDPFAGTPADDWPDGAAGIVLPAAKPIGGFTRDQVKFAYQRTRKLLVAGNLDRRTLLGGAPTAFAKLLTAQDRAWFLNGLNKKGIDKQGDALSTRGMVMAFPPGKAQLIGDAIKVHGTMHARAAVGKGGYNVLDVQVDYLFVYAIEPPHTPASWMRIVEEVGWTVSFGDWAGASTTFEPSISTTGIGGVAGVLCGTSDGYQHPDYPDNPSAGARPSDSPTGTPVDPYVMEQSRPAGCQAVTRT